MWGRWKEICAAHNVKIVLSKPAPLPLDLDIVLPSLSTQGSGPLTWTVTKNRPAKEPLNMTMTPEQAVYSAAFTQALAASCGLHEMNTGGYHDPTDDDVTQAKAWAEAVKSWHTSHETPGFERF